MYIEVYRTRRQLTKAMVRQMAPGYLILCQPFMVLGHVVNVVPDQLFTAIIQSGEDFYALPMDYELAGDKLSCVRKTKKGLIEYNFSLLPESCKVKWWKTYLQMINKAKEKHIFL